MALGFAGAGIVSAQTDLAQKGQRCPASCDDGKPCTVDTCGAATGFQCTHTPVTCTAPDRCHGAGTCDPGTGLCLNPAGQDGAACDDGNACTSADACGAGVCAGTPKTCSGGSCDPATGKCLPCPGERWARAVDSPLVGGVNGLTLDGAGKLYVTGGFGDTIDLGSGVLKSAGSADLYVARLDPATGRAAWAKRFGDDADQSGAGVADDGAGHLVVIGNYTGTLALGGKAGTISSAFDAVFVVGLDAASGTPIWAKSFNLSGGSGGGSLFALAADPTDHGVVIVGNTPVTGAGADFGGGPLQNGGGADAVVVKLAGATGAVKWARQIGGRLNQTAHAVAVDGSGNVFVFGRFTGKVDLPNLGTYKSPNNELFLAKLQGTSGATITARQFGTRGTHTPAGVAVDRSGNVVVAGAFVGTVDFGTAAAPRNLTSAGFTDVFVAKYDNTLATNLWAVRFGDGDEEAAQALALDGAGNVVIGGLFAGALDFGRAGSLKSAGNADAFAAKLEGATGAALCAKAAGDASVQATSGLAVNRTTNEAYLLGNFLSAISWGKTNLTGKLTAIETFIAKLD